MRTDTPTTRDATVARVRAEFARARRRFKSQSPAVRWSLGVATLVVLVALTYAATGTPAPAGGYVRGGQRFDADARITVCDALDQKRIRYRIDDQNRVQVDADQVDAANDVVAKLGVGPRPISEIDDWPSRSSVLDTNSIAQQKQERALGAKLGEMIRPIDGVVSAYVMVNRPKARGGSGRPAQPATAFVYVETDNDRELSSASVESIQGLINGAVPEVKPDAVSVFDRKGRHYLDALDPAIGAESKLRHRRDELEREIGEKLDWLKGAKVYVQLAASPVIPMPNPLPPLPSPAPMPAPAPPSAAPTEEVGLPPTSMSVNQPLELADETDEPARALDPPPAPAPVPVPPPPAPPAAVEHSLPPRARVWVKVPRSYYLKALPNREPSLDDLQPFVERTKALIETAVRHVIPPGQLDEPVEISTIPDDLPAQGPPPSPPAAADARRINAWWVPEGVAIAAIGGGLAVALVLAARRPAPQPAARPRDDHGRYTIGEPSDTGPGPSERVRELIRLNPEAAASVLHRWTGRGGNLG